MPANQHDFAQVTKSEDFRKSFEFSLSEGLPFMLYRIPGYDPEIADIQGSSEYIVKPWNDSVFALAEVRQRKPSTLPSETSQKEYREKFSKYAEAFEKGLLKKAILSAIIRERKPENFSAVDFFYRLCEKYPGAFCYLLFHPDHGTWCGATPEVLVEESKGIYHTVALAGTQPCNSTKNYDWQEKEKEEQGLVSDHIRKTLQDSGATDIKESSPYTVRAGEVVHLKTDFRFNFERPVKELLESLHPTPAVAGLPVSQSIDLINRTESHNRDLYSGYLGILSGTRVNVFVNLRCMQIGTEDVALYVGGGLTAKSDVESEWMETRLKAKTLLNLLKTGH